MKGAAQTHFASRKKRIRNSLRRRLNDRAARRDQALEEQSRFRQP